MSAKDWYLNKWTVARLSHGNVASVVGRFGYRITEQFQCPFDWCPGNIVLAFMDKGHCAAYALIDDLYFLYVLVPDPEFQKRREEQFNEIFRSMIESISVR